jgi:hypothetical protein
MKVKSIDKYYLLFIPLFLINPFGTITIILLLSLLYPFQKKDNMKIALFLLAIFMGLIQSMRIVEVGQPSDWVGENGYITIFLNAGTMDFLQYMQQADKEPVFALINYIGYYLFNGNFILFAATLVFIMYAAFYMSIYKFWEVNSKDVRSLLIAIVFFTFMTENLAMVNNIIRHQFAMGLMTYVYVQKIVEKKMNWCLALVACFTHTFMFAFLAILFIKPLGEVIRLKSGMQIFVAFTAICIILQCLSFLLPFLSVPEQLSYGIMRIANTSSEHDAAFMIGGGTVIYYNIVFFLLIALKLNYLNKPISASQIFFTNIALFLMIICAVLQYVSPMIQTRLYITRNFLAPFAISLLFDKNFLLNGIYSWVVVFFFYIRFVLTFNSIGDGEFFPSITELVVGSILYFFKIT